MLSIVCFLIKVCARYNKAMVTTVDEALAAANRIGYPVMLKASEGGGGKGIRMSDNDDELMINFDQVKAEVPGSPMFMMQLCSEARHLEVRAQEEQQVDRVLCVVAPVCVIEQHKF